MTARRGRWLDETTTVNSGCLLLVFKDAVPLFNFVFLVSHANSHCKATVS